MLFFYWVNVDGFDLELIFHTKNVCTFVILLKFYVFTLLSKKNKKQKNISVQALTTGSIPGFIDVVMNLNSPVLLEDNLIWQAKTAGKRIIFYGDDTWVRLFPKHFMEYDGTTSFFVSDYTEVWKS